MEKFNVWIKMVIDFIFLKEWKLNIQMGIVSLKQFKEICQHQNIEQKFICFSNFYIWGENHQQYI